MAQRVTQWGLVGRWVAWMPRGVFIHRPIAATPQMRGETAIGWIFHYAVGIVYAALYLAIMRLGFDSGPTVVSALIFAIATIDASGTLSTTLEVLAAGIVATLATDLWNRLLHIVVGLPLAGHLAEHKEDRDDLSKWGNELRQTFRTIAQAAGVPELDVHLLMNHSIPE
jgi:hypothetical protein